MASGSSSLRDREAPTMEQHGHSCPQCSRAISLRDTILVRNGCPTHLDCRRPRMLTPDERAVLFSYCLGHAVAECLTCACRFHLGQLTADPLNGRSCVCPQCCRDLTETVRAHVYLCAILPAEIRAKMEE